MNWEFLPLSQGLGVLQGEWDNLNVKLGGSNPYFDSRFMGNLLKHFPSGREILCVHRCAEGIDAMLILAPGRAGTWRLFNPAQAQIAPFFVTEPRHVQELIADFPGLMLGLECPCQDPDVTPLARLSDRIPAVSADHVRTIAVQLEGSFKEYWAGRSGNLRKAIARRTRRLHDADYAVRLRRLDDAALMRAAVARFGEIESQGWKGREGSAMRSDNVQGAFYADVMEDFAARGEARVYELYFNESLVAMQLCLLSPTMTVLLKTTYDENYSEYSPGRILQYLLLEHEFEQARVRWIEFYTNANSDQLSWATHERVVMNFLLFRNAAVKASYFLLRRGWRAIKSLKIK